MGLSGEVKTKTMTKVRVVKMGEGPKDISFEGGATVADALSKAGMSSENIDKVRVNGEPVSMDTKLPENAILTIVSRVEGGK